MSIVNNATAAIRVVIWSSNPPKWRGVTLQLTYKCKIHFINDQMVSSYLDKNKKMK